MLNLLLPIVVFSSAPLFKPLSIVFTGMHNQAGGTAAGK